MTRAASKPKTKSKSNTKSSTSSLPKTVAKIRNLNAEGNHLEAGKRIRTILPDIHKQEPELYIETLTNLGVVYLETKRYKKALRALEKAKKLAAKHHFPEQEGRIEFYIGRVYYGRNKIDHSLFDLKRAVRLLKDKPNSTNEYGHALHTIGRVYQKKGNHNRAFHHYEKSVLVFKKLKDKLGLAIVYGNLGQLYFEERNYSKALSFFQKDLKLSKEVKDVRGELVMLYQIGELYLKEKKIRLAKRFFTEFNKRARTRKMVLDLGLSYVCLGAVALCEDDLKSAKTNLKKAAKTLESVPYPPTFGNFFEKQADLLLALGERDQAVASMHRAIEIFERFSFKSKAIDAKVKKALVLKQIDRKEAMLLALEIINDVAKSPSRTIDSKVKERLYHQILELTCNQFDATSAMLFFCDIDDDSVYMYNEKRKTKMKIMTGAHKFREIMTTVLDEPGIVHDKRMVLGIQSVLKGRLIDKSKLSMMFAPIRKIEEEIGGILVVKEGTDDFFKHEDELLLNHFVEFEEFIDQLRRDELTYYDGLTKLFHRKNFDSHLRLEHQRALREQIPFSLVMIDIDHFKKFNDNYGHQVGDVVLKRVSASIQGLIRTSDVAGRYGGEEIILLLPQMPMRYLDEFTERVRHRISQIDLSDLKVKQKVTISLGSTTFDPEVNAVKPDELVKQADIAMYTAKTTGRNRSVNWQNL
ncbi:MAG: GGDEF domain-containing protein [Candidatus Lindowbacteria bacterium]|nr:GGDEF domain-containing protein [Candidatus Lindowbacteria bacterium]